MEYYNKIDNIYITALKNNVIHPVIKVELMDYEENVFTEIQQDISSQDSGSISVNYQQGIRRSCSLTLVNDKGQYTPSLQNRIWINTKFKVYIGIKVYHYKNNMGLVYILGENGNYLVTEESTLSNNTYIVEEQPYYKSQTQTDIYWFSQGVFIMTDPITSRSLSSRTITLNGVDKFGIFGSETNFKETDGTYLIPAGTTVQKLIMDILQEDMGNGKMLDATPPVIDYSIADSQLPYDIEKSPEQYFSEILTEIGNIFACDIFYDTEGRLNFTKGNENKDMNNYGSLWDYIDVLPDYSEVENTYDFTNVYNVIKVIGNNPDCPSYQAIVKNDITSSPTAIQIIGEKIKYVESSFCYNQDRTYDFAKYLLRKYSIIQQSLSFQSTIIPHLEVNNIITLTDSFFGYNQERFVIQALTFPISLTGTVTVEASNTANIPYFEY